MFYESTPSTQDPMEISSSQGPDEVQGTEAGVPDASTERDHEGTSEFSRVLLKCIPGTQSVGRVASSERSKRLNSHIFAPHIRMFAISSVLSTIRKRRLCVQNRSAESLLSCTDPSKQQEVSLVSFREQNISILNASLRSEHSSSGIYSFGAHCGRLPPSFGDIGNRIPRRLASPPPRSLSFTLPPVSATTYARLCRLQFKHKEVRAGPSSGYPVSQHSFAPGSGKSLTPRVQGSEDSSTHVRNILPTSSVVSTSVPVHGFTQMSLRSHPIGSSTSEATTNRFTPLRWSDQLILANLLQHRQDPSFLPFGNSQRTFPGRLYDIYGRLYTGMGAHMGDSQIWDTWTCTDGKLHINSASGPPGYDHYGQYNSSFLYQQTGKGPLPLPVMSSSGSLYVASSSEHGLQSQPCLNVIADCLSRPNQPITTEWSLHSEIVARIFHTWGAPKVDMFATVNNTHLPQFMSQIPEPQALAIHALSQDWQLGAVNIHVSMLNKVIQKLPASQKGEVILISPW